MHTHAMCRALERKGAQVEVFYTPDFPQQAGLTIDMSAEEPILRLHGASCVELAAEVTSVWVRRPYFSKPSGEFDETDQAMIARECRDMRLSFFDLLCPSAFWVNPITCFYTERCKPTQLVMAKRFGFQIPPTLVSNDPSDISRFYHSAKGQVIYKTFNALLPTSLLTDDLLSEPETLRWTPGIYQRYVEKDHELRVTVVGEQIFVVRINSQQTMRGKVDWREAQWKLQGETRDLTFEPATLPEPVEKACRSLVRALGLAYGAIDLIVTPEQEYVFLEVNPTGQFLWIDVEAGLPVLDALAEMLIQGKLDYTWDRGAPEVLFDAELQAAAEILQSERMAQHVCDLAPW
jgi:glutathione synthase/RimK-type ligase-like ATP-grasp enzyme